jgi:predicted PurR-regulated permease PerM
VSQLMHWQRWLVLILAGVFLFMARRILPPFIIAGVIAYILSPLVGALKARGVRRPIAVVAVYLGLLAPIVAAVVLLRPGLTAQTRELLRTGPDLIENAVVQATGNQPIVVFGSEVTPRALALRITGSLRDGLGRPGDALHAAEQAVELILNLLLMLLALFYFLMDGKKLGSFVLRFVPEEQRGHLAVVGPRIHGILGRFLGGQAVLVALMSAVTFLMLHFVFQLRFALPIAVATGFLEVIPVIGPITAGAIACVVALGQGGIAQAAWVALAYLVLRQVEDQFVMPQIVGRVVHLHPLVTIFAVLAGGAVAGILGTVLAVPAAASLKVVLDYAYPDPLAETAKPEAGLSTQTPAKLAAPLSPGPPS